MTGAEMDVDAAALEPYLEAELGVPVAGLDVLHDGLNLTVAIETVDGGEAYVLRRPNKLRDAGYMNDLEGEYGVLQRLAETAVPAPVPVLFCDDESVIGERFFVTTALDGEAVPLGADLPERFRHPRARERIANSLVETLADVHSVAVEPFAPVCERRPPREQVVESVGRLDEAAGVTGHDVPTLRAVGEWLLEHAPADPATMGLQTCERTVRGRGRARSNRRPRLGDRAARRSANRTRIPPAALARRGRSDADPRRDRGAAPGRRRYRAVTGCERERARPVHGEARQPQPPGARRSLRGPDGPLVRARAVLPGARGVRARDGLGGPPPASGRGRCSLGLGAARRVHGDHRRQHR